MKTYKLKKYLVSVQSAKIKTPIHFMSQCYAENAYTFGFEKEFLASILESGLDMMEEIFKSIESDFMKELGKVW